MRFLTNIIGLKIKSAEGKNNNYKKNIIGMKFVEARDLADVLKSSVDLVICFLTQLSLNLSGNLIDDELFKFISPGLNLNITIVDLNLSYNQSI